MASVKVFGSPASTEVARVLACLWEKDVDFQLVQMDTYKGQHKIPEFIRLQDPSAQVTYQEEDSSAQVKTLRESRKICRHVCENYTHPRTPKLIFGDDEQLKKDFDERLQEEEKDFEPPSSQLIFYLAFAPYIKVNIDKEVINYHASKLESVLNKYEEQLGKTDFLVGNDFTLADLYHLPNLHYLVNKTTMGYNMVSAKKKVRSWWEKISSRPSWKMVVQIQEQHPGPVEK